MENQAAVIFLHYPTDFFIFLNNQILCHIFHSAVSQLAIFYSVSTVSLKQFYKIIFYNFPIDKLLGENGCECCASPERGCYEYTVGMDRH